MGFPPSRDTRGSGINPTGTPQSPIRPMMATLLPLLGPLRGDLPVVRRGAKSRWWLVAIECGLRDGCLAFLVGSLENVSSLSMALWFNSQGMSH